MSLDTCKDMGKPGYRCGSDGKCYTYTPGNEVSRRRAKQTVIEQCLALDEFVSEADLQDVGLSNKHPHTRKKKKKRKLI